MYKLQKFEKKKLDQQINKKWVRVITVIIYIISVSLVAIILGLYYRFWWKADYSNTGNNNGFEPIKIATFKIPRKLNNKSVNITEYLDEVFNKLKLKGVNFSMIQTPKQYFEDDNEQFEFELMMMVIQIYP